MNCMYDNKKIVKNPCVNSSFQRYFTPNTSSHHFSTNLMHWDLPSRPVEMEETDADDPRPLPPTQPASEPATRLRFRLSSLIYPGEQSI